MKLEFDDPQSSYTSGSQSARASTGSAGDAPPRCPGRLEKEGAFRVGESTPEGPYTVGLSQAGIKFG